MAPYFACAGDWAARVRAVGPLLVPARDGGARPGRQEPRKGSIHPHHAGPVRAKVPHTQSLTPSRVFQVDPSRRVDSRRSGRLLFSLKSTC